MAVAAAPELTSVGCLIASHPELTSQEQSRLSCLEKHGHTMINELKQPTHPDQSNLPPLHPHSHATPPTPQMNVQPVQTAAMHVAGPVRVNRWRLTGRRINLRRDRLRARQLRGMGGQTQIHS